MVRGGPFSHPREGRWGHAVRAPVRGARVPAPQFYAGLASPAGLARALSAPASSPEPRAGGRIKVSANWDWVCQALGMRACLSELGSVSQETVGISKVMDLGEEGTEPPLSNAQPWGQESSQEKDAPSASAGKLASDVPAAPLSPGIKLGAWCAHRGPLPYPLPWLSLRP